MVEKQVNKTLASVALVMIKTLPMLISFLLLVDTILCYFDIDVVYAIYLKEFIVIAYLYLTSYLFKLCWRYRLFIHYIAAVQLVNLYDQLIGIPVSDETYCIVIMIVSPIYFFYVLYQFLKS